MRRFEIEVLGLQDAGNLISDVGVRTVRGLDELLLAFEQREARRALLQEGLSPALPGVLSAVNAADVFPHATGAEAFGPRHICVGHGHLSLC